MDQDVSRRTEGTRSDGAETADDVVSALLDASHEYIKDQKKNNVQLSPTLNESSPGVILSRALAGAAKIQRL